MSEHLRDAVSRLPHWTVTPVPVFDDGTPKDPTAVEEYVEALRGQGFAVALFREPGYLLPPVQP